MINFDCCAEKYPIEPGDKVLLVEDLYYSNKENCDEELFEEYSKWMKVDRDENDNLNLYIPAGTIMTFLGNKYNCWPTFKIENKQQEEIDLATEQIIKMVKINKV